MNSERHILWIGPHDQPPANVALAMKGYPFIPATPKPLHQQLSQVPLAVVWPNGQADNPARLAELLGQLEQAPALSLFLLPESHHAWSQITSRNSRFLCLPDDSPPHQIAGWLNAAWALAPALSKLENDLSAARDSSRGSAKIVEELDEEMRLAARLQRDFLPRRLPEVGPARFGVLYRPATWVSGDIYDVARLDETHVGFYVADVVGHGMPAALLTMFIKRAFQTKRIIGSSYQIVPPDEALAELNTDICEQNLSSSQFCTAVYGVLDVSTMRLSYSRAGHPEPLLIHPDGSIEHLPAQGSLLGIFEEESYELCSAGLVEGDRLLLFSDGAEDSLCSPESPRGTPLEQLIAPYLRCPRDELLMLLAEKMDALHEGQQLPDDVTVVVLDIER